MGGGGQIMVHHYPRVLPKVGLRVKGYIWLHEII